MTAHIAKFSTLLGPNAGKVQLADESDVFVAFVCDDVTAEIVGRVSAARGWAASAVQCGDSMAAIRTLAVIPPPKILLVDLAGSQEPLADLAAMADMTKGQSRIVALGAVNDMRLYRDLLAAGASDYLLKPVTAEAVEAAIARTEKPAGPGAETVRSGRAAVFIGARGGVGASTVAANAAWTVAHDLRRRTVLVDFDLQFGTAALAFDLEPNGGFREALATPERVDDLLLDRAMIRAGERLMILGAEESLDTPLTVTAGAAALLMEKLRLRFDLVVVELPRTSVADAHDLLGAANDIVVVTDLSLAGLRDSVRLTRLAGQVAPTARVSIVANRTMAERKTPVAEGDFARGLGRKIDYVIPFDPKAFSRAANAGQPVARAGGGKDVIPALRKLGAALAGVKAPPLPFWRRWLG
ncbi:MAG: pilus assembly protein CpaE [Rhodospirillales bacterium]|nr:pilus assembly protein CpaE [Rhodospirillales bacterium]